MEPKKNIAHYFYDLLIEKGLDTTTAKYLNILVGIILLFIVVLILDFILRKVFINLLKKLAANTKTHFDDHLLANKTPNYLAHLLPLVLVITILPYLFFDFPKMEKILEIALDIYIVFLIIWLVRSILRTFRDYLKTKNSFKDKPIDSYIQVFMIFSWFVAAVVIFSLMTGKSVWTFLTALGALSAVILLIFKDTILGFVASIQISINDMVRIGDWISMDKYGADGDVTEINLATVKVQNFDKTITTIPTYALISDSFKNWRGMSEAGGRRIKRALIIKVSSIKYLSSEEVAQLQKIDRITNYLKTKQKDILEFNTNNLSDKSLLINGRNLTNMGVFRKYVETYVEAHPAINENMTIMSRQLPPSSQGIPLEIYAFSKDKVWKNYEYIMADIFDHLIAAVTYFDLEIYELPTGKDFNK